MFRTIFHRDIHANMRPLWVRALACGLLALNCCGCQTLKNRGPLAKGARLARQLSDKGLDAIHVGDWSKAEQHFQDAIRHCPKDGFVREKYANCLRRNGDTSGAIHQLIKAIELCEEQNVDLIVQLGELFMESGNTNDAMRQADRALNVESNNPHAWKLKGDLQRRLQQPREALASYHRALAYDSNNVELQIATSEIYYQLRRPRRTLASLDRLVQQDRSIALPAKVFHLRGLAFNQLDRHDDAVAELVKARDRSRYPSARILIDLASSQMNAGQISAAEITAEEALRVATPTQRSAIQSLQYEIAKLQPDLNFTR